VILPGATIGVLGGGQLGRMLALEARRMGYRVEALDPDPTGPAGQVCDHVIAGSFRDVEAARSLALRCDVITLETEHIALPVLEAVAALRPLHPAPSVLATVQDRLAQRRFLDQVGVPHTPYAEVSTLAQLGEALDRLGRPAILKTRREGYDGKGQARIRVGDDPAQAWSRVGGAPSILEAFVPFEREISVLLARAADGSVAVYPVAENDHRNHILHTTVAPARVSGPAAAKARDISIAIAEGLGIVGMMAVELFALEDGQLLVNEVAPRTHNSGHFTYGGAATSQFEQHARAILGLPLGDTHLFGPCVMVNLLGDLWSRRDDVWRAVASNPMAHLHLYGKANATPGRKMGHVLLLDPDTDAALSWAEQFCAFGAEPSVDPGR
jgi:5-(carboxyamino)imidazole ribonucleotide synthase